MHNIDTGSYFVKLGIFYTTVFLVGTRVTCFIAKKVYTYISKGK